MVTWGLMVKPFANGCGTIGRVLGRGVGGTRRGPLCGPCLASLSLSGCGVLGPANRVNPIILMLVSPKLFSWAHMHHSTPWLCASCQPNTTATCGRDTGLPNKTKVVVFSLKQQKKSRKIAAPKPLTNGKALAKSLLEPNVIQLFTPTIEFTRTIGDPNNNWILSNNN